MSDLTMDVSDHDAILLKIAEAEKKLADLLRQKEETEVELHSLRERLEKGSDQNLTRQSRNQNSLYHLSLPQ